MNLNLGCGNHKMYDFVNVDFDPRAEPDLLIDDILNIGQHYEEKSINSVVLSHVLEHFYLDDQELLLKNIHQLLKEEGLLYVSVPNLQRVCGEYFRTKDLILLKWIYGNGKQGHHAHHWGFTVETLDELMIRCGFKFHCDFDGLEGDSSFTYDGVLLSINRVYIK